MQACKHGVNGDCGRKEVARGMCSSHYRRWRLGKPLDEDVRTYARYEEGPDGIPVEVSVRPKVVREAPFAKERALLASLALDAPAQA
jgi:hypothetical protein